MAIGETVEMRDTVSDIRCHRCRIAMEKKPAPHGLNFKVDVCDSCGIIWLDHGELETIHPNVA